jgi:DNA-binding HxlR family transcriptional regulator
VAPAAVNSVNSVNSFGRGLLIVGDQWSMSIICEAFRGTSRFQDFKENLGISDPVLTQRLRSLVTDEVFETRRYSDRPPRSDYHLTKRGRELWTVFIALWEWDLRWAPRHRGGAPVLIHDDCGHPTTPLFGCQRCGAVGVTHRHTRASRRPGTTFAQSNPARRYRRSPDRLDADHAFGGSSLELLGDRWSISVLGAGMLRIRRFGDIRRELEISPFLLSERLQKFVDNGVMGHVPIAADQRRKEYRLLPKGLDMMPVFAITNDWANRWYPDPEGLALEIRHEFCGQILAPGWWCNGCGKPLERTTIHFEP